MQSVPDRRRPRLAATPRLLGAYYAVGNRWRRRGRRDRSLLIGLVSLWAALIALLAGCSREALSACCVWLTSHGLPLAAASLAGAVILVSRRRSVVRADAARSWLAALAVPRGAAFFESRTLEWVPALCLLGVVAIGGASLLAVAASRGIATLLSLAQTVGALEGAVLIGALCSYLIPPGRDEDLPPGSRYVPHRRRTGPPLPRASLTGLAQWPVRRLFALLRPKVVTRAVVPVLMAVPLGASADSALVMLGVTATSAALLLFLVSLRDASRASQRWLRPVSLSPSVVCQALLGRALAGMTVLAALWGGLVWAAGMTARDALQRSLCLWSLCATIAVGLVWFATHRRAGP